jgi:hypothetical protein
MNRFLAVLLALWLLPSVAFAQVCPAGSTCAALEAYIYGQATATAPFAGSLRIPAIPSATSNSTQWIAANLLATLSDPQTLTSKTINGANNTLTVRIANDVSGLAANVAAFLATASSANLRAALTDETGTGLAYFQGGDIGNPSAGVATNLTGTAAGLTAGNVTTNANLTGPVTSSGNATAIANGAIGLAKLGNEVDGQCIVGAAGVWGAAACPGGGGTGANPTATASDVAVNGVASTFMRSDAAPAVQKTSGSVFGLAKVDGTTITATGGVISATSGTGTVTSVTLAAGLAKTAGTRNNGADAITTTGTINLQVYPVTKATSYTVNADNGGTSDSGALLIATAASVTFTLPNPAAGTKGITYQFGSDGTNGFTLTTVGGTATLYGYSGGGGASVVFPVNRDVLCTDDGTNYKCTVAASQIVGYALTYAPGINPNNLLIAHISEAKLITGIRCTPEVLAGGAATISIVKAASGTLLSAGTVLHSGSFNANSAAGTDQSLTVTVTTLAAGDRLGTNTTGTTVWTSSGVAQGGCTVLTR